MAKWKRMWKVRHTKKSSCARNGVLSGLAYRSSGPARFPLHLQKPEGLFQGRKHMKNANHFAFAGTPDDYRNVTCCDPLNSVVIMTVDRAFSKTLARLRKEKRDGNLSPPSPPRPTRNNNEDARGTIFQPFPSSSASRVQTKLMH